MLSQREDDTESLWAAQVIESDNDLENDQLMAKRQNFVEQSQYLHIFKVICVPTKTAKISTTQKFPCLQ